VTTATALATALAERLDRALPQGFSAQASGTTILVRRAHLGQVDSTDIEWVFERDLSLAENLTWAADRVLDAVQDIVTEALAEPWPRPDPDSREVLPTPGTTIAGTTLRAWYGAERRPVLELDPIPMRSLSDAR
jgi:hypothetical protein